MCTFFLMHRKAHQTVSYRKTILTAENRGKDKMTITSYCKKQNQIIISLLLSEFLSESILIKYKQLIFSNRLVKGPQA